MKSRLLPILLLALATAPAGAQVDLSNNPINPSWGDPLEPSPVPAPATAGQFGSMAGISSSAARNRNPLSTAGTPADQLRSNLPSAGNLILNRSFFGGSFSGSVPDLFIGDEIALPGPRLVSVDGSDTLVEFRPEPVAPGESFKRYNPNGSIDTFSRPNLNTTTVPPDYEDFYWSKHAEKTFASKPGRVTVHYRSLNRVKTEPGSNEDVFVVVTKTIAVSAGAAREPRKIFWTDSRFTGPPVSVPASVVQEVKIVYSDTMPGIVADEDVYVPEGEVYDPGANNSGGGISNKTVHFDTNSRVLRAYNREGRLLVEYLGQPRTADPSIRVHLGIEIVDAIQETPPTAITTHIGDRILPSDGKPTTEPTAAQSPDGFLLLDPDNYTPYRVPDILNIGQAALNQHFVDNREAYYAVAENNSPNRVQLYWLQQSPVGDLGILWPSLLNSYRLEWPHQIDGKFVLNARPADTARTAETNTGLALGTTPQLIFQDDPTGAEAKLNTESQFEVSFLPDSDNINRSLLLFQSAADFWYLRVFSYIETYIDAFRDADRSVLATDAADARSDLDAQDAAIDAARDALASAEAALVLDPDNTTKQQAAADAADALAAALSARPPLADALFAAASVLHLYDNFLSYHLRETVPVGQRIESPGGASSLAGYIASGTAYNPDAYIDPFASSLEAAAAGAIIPVNARPGHDHLKVWWFDRVDPPSDDFQPISWPAIVADYDIVWPGQQGTPDVSEIVLAANAGTGDLPPDQIAGNIYNQPDPALPGYNPNEEHAIKLDSRYYALRDDLALYHPISGDLLSSEPYVLVDYTDSADGRPSTRAFRVVRETATHQFDYPATAGTPLGAPLPLSVLPVPLLPDGTSANTEVIDEPTLGIAPDLPPVTPTSPSAADYDGFTFEDRKGLKWIYRGPHDGTSAVAFGMKFRYNTLPGFSFPGFDPTSGLPTENAPPLGTIVPFLRPFTNGADPSGGFDGDPQSGLPLTVKFNPVWPLGTPQLRHAETLTTPKFGLPAVRGRVSAEVLYQQSLAGENTSSVTLYDPTRAKFYELDDQLSNIPGVVRTTSSQGRTYFQDLPPHLQQRFYYDPLIGQDGALVLVGELVEGLGEPYLLPNVLSVRDVAAIQALADGDPDLENQWDTAVTELTTIVQTFDADGDIASTAEADSTTPARIAGRLASDVAVDSYALAAVDGGSGFVTLAFEDSEFLNDAGDPVSIAVIRVGGGLYTGEVKPILPANPLSEKVTLQHTADFAGDTDGFEFQWVYSPPADGLPPSIPGAPDAPTWLPLGDITRGLNNTVFGSGLNPLLTLSDNYILTRYRPADGHALYPSGGYPDDETGWSNWTSPALVEGWIKRVLAGINPFNQRLTDFFNSAVNTDISLLTQAGTRWEGDVALNLDNINDASLIEIYETVLNRGKAISIDGSPPVDYAPANDALLLVAGYLADLYTALGDEAFADASNPMITFDSQSIATVADPSISQGFNEFFQQTATARFSFEGQVPDLISEELTLLRGRDDRFAPGIQTAPVYNRFFWNYTRGIDAGEVIYALNYNIRENADNSSDGKVDAADASRLFPQGHGDAYGHYLTALTNYYRLLTDPQFSWAPRIEAVNVLGVPVTVDYLDERRFASAALSIGRASEQIISLVRRESFTDDDSAGWDHLRDDADPVTDPQTGITRQRHWGLDEWASRSAQGGFFNWVVGNALLPAEDDVNEGVQKIDRTTVPELEELTAQASQFQRHADEANLFVNPLGLTNDSVLFDISPSELDAGNTHFEQIQNRAELALQNASAVFERATTSTRLLRNTENQAADLAASVFDQEFAYNLQLIDIYGTPYPGDIGPGKPYAQDYEGPDLLRYMFIDKPDAFIDRFGGHETFTVAVPSENIDAVDRDTNLSDPTSAKAIGELLGGIFGVTRDIREFEEFDDAVIDRFDGLQTLTSEATISYDVDPDRTIQYVASGSLGRRAKIGSIQKALLRFAVAQNELLHTIEATEKANSLMLTRIDQLEEVEAYHTRYEDLFDKTSRNLSRILLIKLSAEIAKKITDSSIEKTREAGQIAVEGFPKVVGFSNDVTSVGRVGVLLASTTVSTFLTVAQIASEVVSEGAQITADGLQFDLVRQLHEAGFPPETLAVAAEVEEAYNALAAANGKINTALLNLQAAAEEVASLESEGIYVQRQREIYRKRVATATQGYRTRDVAFRAFRTEALEEYQTLLDLAAKYAYLAARAYDYETGLLGSSAGDSFLSDIVRTRALGLVAEDGQPQLAGSQFGDPGISGLLYKLDSDWQVARTRLGFNNPDTYGTTFSLRQENFRIPSAPSATPAWQQRLSEDAYVDDLRADPDVASHALQLAAEDGTPVPGFIIPFSTTIQEGLNFFGKPLAPGDHNFSHTSFATKIHSVGVVFQGYQGMDPCLACSFDGSGEVTSSHPDALGATPYVYLIPTGMDLMRTPPLGDTATVRSWHVHDFAMPLPFNIGDSAFSDVDYWTSASSLSEPFFQPRKHQAFRAVNHAELFQTDLSADFTNSRLIGRSVWNTGWKLVIPGTALLNDPVEGIDRFLRTVTDIQLHLRTYSYSGN